MDLLPIAHDGIADTSPAEPLRALCLDHVRLESGDEAVVVSTESGEHIVVGTLTARPRRVATLASGYSAEVDLGTLVLKDSSGNVALEVDTSQGAPCVRLAPGDVTLDLSGRLALRATSIELQARLGNVTIRANDDAVILGERILLNS